MNYVHSIPGRLRVRSARLRGSPRDAEQLRAYLRAVPAVQSVETNVVPGSALIHYDCTRISLGEIWDVLHREGYVQDRQAPGAGEGESGVDRALTQLTSWVSCHLAEMLAGKIAEASFFAVLAAIV